DAIGRAVVGKRVLEPLDRTPALPQPIGDGADGRVGPAPTGPEQRVGADTAAVEGTLPVVALLPALPVVVTDVVASTRRLVELRQSKALGHEVRRRTVRVEADLHAVELFGERKAVCTGLLV